MKKHDGLYTEKTNPIQSQYYRSAFCVLRIAKWNLKKQSQIDIFWRYSTKYDQQMTLASKVKTTQMNHLYCPNNKGKNLKYRLLTQASTNRENSFGAPTD